MWDPVRVRFGLIRALCKPMNRVLLTGPVGRFILSGNPHKKAPRVTEWSFWPVTLHVCRHGFASIAIKAEFDPKHLATFMGHS